MRTKNDGVEGKSFHRNDLRRLHYTSVMPIIDVNVS